MSFLDQKLVRLQYWIRSKALLYRLTLGTRLLLAVGFIPTGMVKLLGLRFSYMDPASPLGGFFETMYLSGPYWQFLGLSQVLAGILILNPGTATLGAVLFAPIIINIFVITLSYDFNYTPVITGQMVLAVLYLLIWDYDRLRGVLGLNQSDNALPRHRLRGPAERGVYVVGGLAGLAFFGGMRGLFIPAEWRLFILAGCLTSALAAVCLGWINRNSPYAETHSVG